MRTDIEESFNDIIVIYRSSCPGVRFFRCRSVFRHTLPCCVSRCTSAAKTFVCVRRRDVQYVRRILDPGHTANHGGAKDVYEEDVHEEHEGRGGGGHEKIYEEHEGDEDGFGRRRCNF